MNAVEDPRRIVAEGYDRIADAYERWVAGDVLDTARPRYTAAFLAGLPSGAQVLELGCGGGGPTTQQLAARFRLTGVDISARQIEKARHNVPQATFLQGDMTEIDFPPASFNGIASFYAFLHLPAGALPGVLVKCARWLRPGGLLVATMAGGAGAGMVDPDFLGTPMYFSGYAPEENWRFVREAGLEMVTTSREHNVEDGWQVGFLWLIARKPERVGAGLVGQVPP